MGRDAPGRSRCLGLPRFVSFPSVLSIASGLLVTAGVAVSGLLVTPPAEAGGLEYDRAEPWQMEHGTGFAPDDAAYRAWAGVRSDCADPGCPVPPLEESFSRFTVLDALPPRAFGISAPYLLAIGVILAAPRGDSFRPSTERSAPESAQSGPGDRPRPTPSRNGSSASPRRSSAMRVVKGWYLLMLALAALLTLLMGALGEGFFFVLFGAIALYFLRRYRHQRQVQSAGLQAADDGERPEKGGMPLAAIAIAGILLAASATSFMTTARTVNHPDDGICDYDHRPAFAVHQRTVANGSVIQTREYCGDHTGYFLVLHPLQSQGLASVDGSDVTIMGLSPGWWGEILAGMWVLFISLMVLASVNVAMTIDPVFIVCGMRRGILSLATGFLATILFIVAAVGLMVGFSDPAAHPRITGMLAVTGLGLPLYLTAMLVIIAFLSAFFRQRGGGR